MTISAEDIDPARRPRYIALVDAFETAIADGRLATGARLPPQRNLAFDLGVTIGTVGRAYDLLSQRGLVRGEVGRGTFVAAAETRSKPEPICPPEHAGQLDLSTNQPVFSEIQPRVAQLLQTLAGDPSQIVPLLGYPPTAGYARHREVVARWLTQIGAAADSEQIILTCGAQSGISAVLMALTRPGDTVLVERHTYGGFRAAAEFIGLHFETLDQDEAGIVPASLDAAARHRPGSLLFVDPNLHNPTTTVMTLDRRREIAEIARTHDLKILEDDVYGPIWPDRPPPIYSLAPERVVYLNSASKFLAPGIRLGMLAAPPPLVDRIAAAYSQLVLSVSPIMAELFVRAVDCGLVEEAMAVQFREVSERQDLAGRILGHLAIRHQRHGLHLWLELPRPWTGQELGLQLAAQNIRVAPAEKFHVARGMAPRAVRLSIGPPASRETFIQALETISRTLTNVPTPTVPTI